MDDRRPARFLWSRHPRLKGAPHQATESLGVDPQAQYPATVRAFFGAEFVESRAKVEQAVAQGILPAMTRLESAQIEITTYCNLKCQQCSRTLLTNLGEWRNEHLAFDKYLEIIEKLPPAERLVLQGVGEPSLHPQFRDLVRAATETGKFTKVAFQTNGLARSDDFWVELAASFYCSVGMSVDSLDPVVAEVCRSGTDVDFLIKRIQLFRKIFKEFAVSLVASKLNISDIAVTLAKVGDLGPGWVGIQDMMTSEPGIVMDDADRARLQQDLDALRVRYPELHIVSPNMSTGLKKCVAPFVAPYITMDGFLAPCCAWVEPSAYKWTSVLGASDWDAIRSQTSVTDWMERFITADPAPCRACPFNPAITEVEQLQHKREFFPTPSDGGKAPS